MEARSPSDSSPISRFSQIVGREREQSMLREYLRAVLAGHGSVVLISGEAGIGKTTLVDWIAGEAKLKGVRVLSGHCYDFTLTPPFGPWIDAFAVVNSADEGPDNPHPLQAAVALAAIPSQSLLFEQTRLHLERMTAIRPVMIILEDLHWSDPASLELLRYLSRGANTHALLLIGTYRADELSRHHPLLPYLPLLVREAQAERIEVPALRDDEVHALVRSRYQLTPEDEARLVDHLQPRAAGNPFYLTEVLRTLETDGLLQRGTRGWTVGKLDQVSVSPLVRQVIESRLARLAMEDRRLLEVASVIGQDVPLEIWRMIGDADNDRFMLAVERAIDWHILEMPGTASVRFTHALVRETLYHAQALSRRRILHRRVAELLASRSDPPLSMVASHFEQADDRRAIEWLIRAGEQALALYAAHDAISALTRAHDLAVRFARDLPLATYRARASAYAMLGEFDRARRDHESVLQRGRVSGDQRAEWQALVDLGMLWNERDYERTGAYCRAALELAQATGDRQMIAHSLNQVANWYVNQDDPAAALPLHLEALAHFEEEGDQAGVASTLDLLGMTSYLRCDFAASTRYCERAISLLRGLDDRQRLSSCLAVLALNGGDLDSIVLPVYRETSFWITSGEESLDIAHEIGWPAGEAMSRFALSMALGVRGYMGHAFGNAEAALTIAQDIGHQEWMVAAGYALGRIRMELLDLPGAEAHLERTLALARSSGSRFWINTTASVLSSSRVAAGNLAQAAAILGTIVPPSTRQPSIAQYQYWYASTELALARGEHARALANVDELIDAATGARPEQAAPQLAVLRATALERLGRIEDAERTFRSARDSAILYEFLPLCWRIDTALSALYRATNRPRDAIASAERARATIETVAGSIGNELLREQFREQALARIPSRSPREDRTVAEAGLSPRELDVLRLLAEGMSDREIATALFISPRTVMRHVTSILTKLEVPSRTAAATLAVRQKLV